MGLFARIKKIQILLATLLWGGGLVLAAEDRPLIWRVSDHDSHFYLLGSIHILRASDYPLKEIYDIAYDQVDSVTLEVDLDQINDAELDEIVESRGRYSGSRTIRNDLSTSAYNKLRSYMTSNGYQMVDQLRPWVYLTFIESNESDKAGLLNADGVDAHYLSRSRSDGKAVGQLESATQQLNLLVDELENSTATEVEEALVDMIDNSDEFIADTGELIDAWKSGSLDNIESIIGDAFLESGMSDALLSQRNQNWMPTMRSYLDTNQKVMVVVGAAHLIGEKGLLKLLENDGYVLTPLPRDPWLNTKLIDPIQGPSLDIRGSMGRRCWVESSSDLETSGWSLVHERVLNDESFSIEIDLFEGGPKFYRARFSQE